jgi:hypothetical protein
VALPSNLASPIHAEAADGITEGLHLRQVFSVSWRVTRAQHLLQYAVSKNPGGLTQAVADVIGSSRAYGRGTEFEPQDENYESATPAYSDTLWVGKP